MLFSAVIAAPSSAATEFPITVTPDLGHPTDVLAVSGDVTEPVCANDGIAIGLVYGLPSGFTDYVGLTTVTDASGHFTGELAIPENAVAGAESSVQAVVSDCDGVARASVPVPIDIQAYDGQFILDRTTGKPGQVVHFSGTNCWGNQVAVTFGSEKVTAITLNSDRTFSGSYLLPHLKAGTYAFAATCPGTQFASRTFTLLGPTRPRVVSTTPANHATGVSVTANVTATFSTPMKAGSINRTTFKLFRKGSTTRVPASVAYNATTRTATLNPDHALKRRFSYVARVTTGAQDTSGVFLDQDRNAVGLQAKTWMFTARN